MLKDILINNTKHSKLYLNNNLPILLKAGQAK
jgi:hypothetical protein